MDRIDYDDIPIDAQEMFNATMEANRKKQAERIEEEEDE